MARNIRTDLALEARAIYQEQVQENMHGSEPPGVEVENAGDEDIKITRVRIKTPEGEKALGKPIGNYITLEIPDLIYHDQELYEKTCQVLAKELVKLVNLKKDSTILIVGLGNWNVTPDALGPRAVSSVMVTRHLLEYVPDQVDEGVRPVCALSPGVLGITGIETGEVIKGIVDKVRPELVIVIDALASRKMDRIGTTIQIGDTGISPGSGVGNKRMAISKDTLGIPVIAIGVPTVVDAATMANDTIDMVIDSMIEQAPRDSQFYTTLKNLDRDEKYELIQAVMQPYEKNLVVTPKEIDDIIERMSKIIANGLNIALHEGITLKDVNRYVH